MAKTSPATEELNLAPKYNVQMLHALEHFLSKDKAQTGLIQNLIKDYQPKITITKAAGKDQQVSTPGSISWGTIWKVAKSFLKAPVQTYRLLSFYQNQEKYNTNEFQQALIKSDKTWKFVDNTVDNLENINTLMVNMGVDLFHEGNPLDNKGMKHLQSALKTPEVTTALKDLAISSLQPSANNMELASKLLDMISKAPSINSYLTEKGPSIQFYIQNSVASKIEQDAEKLQQWNNLLKNEIGLEGKAFEQAKRKFLQKAGIAGEALDIAIRDGSLPNGLENNLAQYGLGKQDISKILEIVPVLLTSPNELKQILDAVNAGQYSDIARQVIDLAESKPEIKEYLDNNKETFGKIIVSMMKDHKQFSESGLGGQVYELVPALLNNPTAIKEVIGLYDKSEYYEIAPKIFDLVAKDPSIKDYFSKNAQGFEALINNVVTSNIKTSQEALAEENQAWITLSPEGKKNYLDTNETWKDVSDFAKERMLTKGKLQDFGDTLEIYGIEKDDISTLSHLVMMTFNSPSNLSGVLSTFAKSDYTGMTKDIFRLFEESPEINTYLKEEKAFIARVVKANLLYSPDLQEIDVTDLVPFLLEHPKELSNIVKLVQEEKYSEIAPQILKLSQEDRGIADYLATHKVVLTKAALKSTGFDKYGLSNEIADVFVQLTTKENLPKLQKIAELAGKEEWVKVGISLTDLIDKDAQFQTTLGDNKENINKIVDIILLNNPSLRSSLAGVETGTIANNIISDPASIRDLFTAYESGSKISLATQAAKLVTKKLFDTEFTGALYNSAVNWIYGVGEQQQQIVTAIAGALNYRKNPLERVVLSDFVKQAFDEIAENTSSTKDKNKFLQQISNQNFFDSVELKGSKIAPLKLQNLEINQNQFVNTSFQNVSFAGSKFTEVAFNGATFSNTSFEGAIIDASTLKSLLPELRKDSISLNGVKIEGSLDKLDLKGISFKGADLSAITSMEGTNLLETDLQEAILPVDKNILTFAFNLPSANFTSGVLSETILDANKVHLSNIIATQLADYSSTKGTNLSTTEKENLTIKINELYNDESIIGQRFRQAISANPEQLFEHAFPESSASISHVAQYSGTTSHQLTMLYNNIKNPEKIESALVADIIGEKVTINLFGEGANRGKDGLQIHKALTTVITEFSNINKLSPREILESPDFDKIITEITNEISAKTKYTTAGLATSGIYLPDNAITKTMIQGFTEKVNLAAGDYKLTSQELSSTKVLATSIASNLFGKEAETTHVADIAQIEKLLIKTLYTIKEEHPNLNLENALTTNRELLVGSLDRGYLSTTGEGMTKLFYDQCNYSGTALSAGIKSSQFRTNLKEQITESIQENIAHSKVKPIKKSSLKTIIPPKTKLAAKDIGAILGSPNSNTTNKKPITKVVPKSKGR